MIMTRKTLTLALLVAALNSSQALTASDQSLDLRVEAKKTELKGVTNLEVAGWAVGVIANAQDEQKSTEAIAVVRAVVSKNPSLVTSVVGRISERFPDLSMLVASEAASLLPRQAFDISRAAASAAPRHASQIAAAVAKAVPASATSVARASAVASPDLVEQIVQQVVAAVPAAGSAIQNDAAITRIRVTRSAANEGPTTGNVTTFGGTIRGTVPDGDPTVINSSQVSPGSDPDRLNYGRPR